MTALDRNRNTPELAIITGGFVERVIGAGGGEHLYAGSIGCVDSSGYALPGETATGLKPLGRVEAEVDNTDGSDGDLTVRIKPGVFKFGNSASSDAIAADDIGKDCYVVDDQTVALTDGSSTRSKAGKVVSVDTDGGVFVAIGLEFLFA